MKPRLFVVIVIAIVFSVIIQISNVLISHKLSYFNNYNSKLSQLPSIKSDGYQKLKAGVLQTSCTAPTEGCGGAMYWDSSQCVCRCPSYPTCNTNEYWDSYACQCKPNTTICTEPSGGCGTNYYWNSSTCSCNYSPSTCVTPQGGCGNNYVWDSSNCSCVYSPPSCISPSGGCGTNYYWSSSNCSCEFSSSQCSPPSAGCGNNYYWDSSTCSCKYSGPACNEPGGGCGNNYYWDAYSCSCKPSTTTCIQPPSGCPVNYYWDTNSCSCMTSISNCTAPSYGCGTNYYWDSNSCSCIYSSYTSSGGSGGSGSSYCTSPTNGCGTNYYWDSYYCACRPSTTTTSACTYPTTGCEINYYWDSSSCICRPVTVTPSGCSQPSGGCGSNFYWDSYTCSCKSSQTTVNNCYPPSYGCGTNNYWDYNTCLCNSYSTTPSNCTSPSGGCGLNHYWDYYSCMCKPYQSTTINCNQPLNGCGSGFYWDSYSCSCRSSSVTPTLCSPPSVGCGLNMYWDYQGCYCKNNSVYANYGSTYYTAYAYQTNFDRLAYEPADRISCVKSILLPAEYERLRYFSPTNESETNEIQKLGDKTKICWNVSSTTTAQKQSDIAANNPLENEKCLLEKLGEKAYKEIYSGIRTPSYDEHLSFKRCFGNITQDSVTITTNNEKLPDTVTSCLKNVLKNEIYEKVKNGTANVPSELRNQVDRCFGIDPQPFKEGSRYDIPDEIKNCLEKTVSSSRFNEFITGKSTPTDEEKSKAKKCFDNINSTQKTFLPVPAEQIPYIDQDTEKVKFSNFTQDTQTTEGTTFGGKIKLSGIAPPNTTVTIYIYSDPIVVTTTTDDNGNWVYELEQPLDGQKHLAYATVKTDDGKLVKSSVLDFSVIAAEDDLKNRFIDEEAVAQAFKNKIIRTLFIVITIASILIVLIYSTLLFRKIRGEYVTSNTNIPDSKLKNDNQNGKQ